MEVEILGIRHHGVGSALNTVKRLKEFNPDHIIVEGPMELMQSIEGVALDKLKLPLAILAYNPKKLSNSYFYPFADYSPEWQAFKYAKKFEVSLTTADMPLKHIFAMQEEEEKNEESTKEKKNSLAPLPIHNTPLDEIAKLEGYDSADGWWDKYFEESYTQDSKMHFETILTVMGALRERYVNHDFEHNHQREAFMREALRKAKKEKKERVLFICGAWHAPALLNFMSTAKEDKVLISKLPKTAIETSWIPWTNSRLSWKSGYGAGITAPGWYEHLWHEPNDDGKKWLVKVAKVFRKKEIDISTAHVIEAYHLALTLASMRGLSRAGLAEFNEAIISVMCMGDAILLNYITKELTVGNKMGAVPSDFPKLPIQIDFEQKVKTYRLELREDEKSYQLDLRTPRGLEKSIFLHRLSILNIEWGEVVHSRTKGTFKEVWNLAWSPELELNLIDKAIYGNTIELATQNYVNHRAKNSQDISEVIALLDASIVAKLFNSVDFIIKQIDTLTTQSYEVGILIEAVIPLIKISRYSDVRKSDEVGLTSLIENIMYRVVSSLAMACYGLSQQSAEEMFERISNLTQALLLIEDTTLVERWYDALEEVSTVEHIAFLIQGASYRILLDAKRYSSDKVAKGLSKALSIGEEPLHSAYWIEGFLKGSATILLLNSTIWNLLYVWLDGIDANDFDNLLPLLRRTFSRFSTNERAKIGKKATKGIEESSKQTLETIELKNFDLKMANQALEITKRRLYAN